MYFFIYTCICSYHFNSYGFLVKSRLRSYFSEGLQIFLICCIHSCVLAAALKYNIFFKKKRENMQLYILYLLEKNNKF